MATMNDNSAPRLPPGSRRARTSKVSRNGQTGAQFDGYLSPQRPHSSAYDEMFAPDGSVRGPYRALYDSIAGLDASDINARASALDRAMVDQGITFSLSGQERPFPLDLVPRVVSSADWARLERGVTQRVCALEAFLADVCCREG